MIKVCSQNKEMKFLLEKEFRSLKVDKDVIINMGGKVGKATVFINKPSSVSLAYERMGRHSIISDIIPTLQTNRERDYPMIIKDGRRKQNLHFDEDAIVVHSLKEWRVFYNMFNGDALTERIFVPTSEYLLFCTSTDTFFSTKLFRKEGFQNKVLMPDSAYQYNSTFLKPKLWKKIEEVSKHIVRAFDLNFGIVKIGYSSEGEHSFFVHSLKTEIPMIEGVIKPFVENISIAIVDRITYINKLSETPAKKAPKLKSEVKEKYNLIYE